MSVGSVEKRKSINTIIKHYREEKKITMLTCYDYSTAKCLDEAGIDMILVGDSLAMVVLGYENTLQVSIKEMEIFTQAVARGSKKSLIVADMPYLSYEISKEEALRNAGRLIRSGAQAVKLEGASESVTESIKYLTDNSIPVVGHIGFTPQQINAIGGYNIQGKSFEKTIKMYEQAKKLEEAGVFAIVLEMVPEQSAKFITESINTPTIGIGAGKYCSGQVLVIDDMLGKYQNFTPKFVKRYAELKTTMISAIKKYIHDVECKKFPSEDEIFNLNEEEFRKLNDYISRRSK